jgi:hypothetical protein
MLNYKKLLCLKAEIHHQPISNLKFLKQEIIDIYIFENNKILN